MFLNTVYSIENMVLTILGDTLSNIFLVNKLIVYHWG